MTETLESQVNRLANFIMAEVPGEPSQSGGAVDTAIRIIRRLMAQPPERPSREKLMALYEALKWRIGNEGIGGDLTSAEYAALAAIDREASEKEVESGG